MPTGAVDEEALLRVLETEEADAATYWGSEIAREQAVAMDRYYARPYGDGSEVPNRSSVVTHDIQDAINWVMPDLLRHFTQAEDLITVDDDGLPDGDQTLQDAADYLRHVVFKDNDGQEIVHDFIFDGLLSKVGVLQTVWNPGMPSPPRILEGLSASEVQRYISDRRYVILEAQIDGEIESDEQSPPVQPPAAPPAPQSPPPQAALPSPQPTAPGPGIMPSAPPAPGLMNGVPSPMMPMVPQPELTFSLKVQKRPVGRVKIVCLAPEQFRISRQAKSIEEAAYHGAQFDDQYLADIIRDHPDKAFELDPYGANESSRASGLDEIDDERALARFPDENATGRAGSGAEPERARVTIMIEYVRGDFDGDGFVELRRIKRTGRVILENDVVEESEFTAWSPIRVSHRAIGMSVADTLLDIQRIRTVLTRKAMDSLSQSLAPRTVIAKAAIASDPTLLDRLLDHEVGDVIPVEGRPGDVFMPLTTPDVSASAFQAIEYWDRRSEEASGVNRHAMGIQPQAITDTKGGIENLQAAASKRIEQYARWIARSLEIAFGKALRLLVMHQDQERIVKINGRRLAVDPRRWSDEMTVSVHVGMAAESRDRRLQNLALIAGKQELILQTAGPDNPIVKLQNYRATLAKMTQAMGEKSATPYFAEIPADWQPPPQQQKQDPKLIESQARMQMAQQEQAHKAEMAQAEFQRETQLQQARLVADKEIERIRAQSDAAQAAQKADNERVIAEMKAAHEARTAQMKTETEAALARERMGAEMQLARWKTGQEIRLARERNRLQATSRRTSSIGGGDEHLSGGVRLGGQVG